MNSLALKYRPSALICNVCGSTSHEELLTIKKPDRFEKAKGLNEAGYERKWIKCDDCGVAFNHMDEESERVVKQIESSYYEIDLGSERELQKKFDHVMNLPDEKSDNTGRVDRVLSFLDRYFDDLTEVDICDVGCGLGIFPSKLLEEYDSKEIEEVNIIGIEPDPVSYSFVKGLNRFPVINGFFPQAVKGEKFNLITLNKVLEHLPNPVSMIYSIVKHLKDQDSLVYIEVPCITNTWKKPSIDSSLGALHYNLFSINSLTTIIDKTGLKTLIAERIEEPSGKISVYAIAGKI